MVAAAVPIELHRIEAQGLAARRGARALFSGLDFTLGAGDALILTGPNGSGKSSLLRLIAGFGRPAAGDLRWDGARIKDEPEAYRRHLHYVGHQDALKPALTVAETVHFWVDLAAEARIDPALALNALGLAHLAGSPCRFLSSGQRRRLALARLVAWRAPLWLLDEPTVGLDEAALALVAGLIERHRSMGGIVILSTHQPLPLADMQTLSLADYPAALQPAGDEWGAL